MSQKQCNRKNGTPKKCTQDAPFFAYPPKRPASAKQRKTQKRTLRLNGSPEVSKIHVSKASRSGASSMPEFLGVFVNSHPLSALEIMENVAPNHVPPKLSPTLGPDSIAEISKLVPTSIPTAPISLLDKRFCTKCCEIVGPCFRRRWDQWQLIPLNHGICNR